MTPEEFGKRVRDLRKAMKISQLNLAHLCDLQPGYVTNLENGKLNPTLSTINKVAAGLGITPCELIAEEMPKVPDEDTWINKTSIVMKGLSAEDRKRMYELVRKASQLNT